MKPIQLILIALTLNGVALAQDATQPPKHKIGVSYFEVPTYLPIARAARVQGSVTLALRITSNGQVRETTVIEGPPMLRVAAREAVEKWRFLCLDCASGEAFDHTITVDFKLGDPENACRPGTVISFPDRIIVHHCAVLISDPPMLEKRRWWRRILHI